MLGYSSGDGVSCRDCRRIKYFCNIRKYFFENIDVDVVSCPGYKRNKYTKNPVGRLYVYCPQIAAVVFHVNIRFSYFKVTSLSSFVTKFRKHLVFPVR
jgi:hypothetical protein